MIGLIVLIINSWVMAFGHEPFIVKVVALGGAALGEFLLELILFPALAECPWEKIARILNDKNR